MILSVSGARPCRRLPWLDPSALPVGRDRLHGTHLQARRWAHADLPVRSCQCAADTGVCVVDVEGVGHAFGQAECATKAKVALARKLAVILHRLWCDGTSFRWSTQKVNG